MINRFFTIFLAIMMIAGCAKEVAHQLESPADDARELDVKSGENIEISVTLPRRC